MRQRTYNLENAKISPFFPATDYPVLEVSRKLAPSVSMLKGQIVGAITTGISDVQTVTIGGGAGTFRLRFGNARTSALAYNAAAATVRAALEALPTIGVGNVGVSGSAGGPYTITFNLLGAQPILTNVAADDNVTATVAIVHTTPGCLAGAIKAWNPALVTNPASAPTVAGNGSGSAYGAGSYVVSYTLSTAYGESLPSPATTVTVTAAQNLRVSAIGSLSASVTYVNYYVNGVFAARTAPSAGTAAQTDITGATITIGRVPPVVSTAYSATDGSHIPVGVLPYTCSSDTEGNVTLGVTAGTGFNQNTVQEVPVMAVGSFRKGDLVGWDDAFLNYGRLLGLTSNDDAAFLLR